MTYVHRQTVGIAGLERAARLAGEAFGHEDAASLERPGFDPSRWLATVTGWFRLAR
jgi:hypothetical protein